MALLLIKATNATNLDQTKDARGSYKRGDIVAVYEDSQHDGDLETNPIVGPFVLVRVSGLTVAQAQRYLASDYSERIDPVKGFVREPILRRRFYVRVDDLPAAVKTALVRDRFFETTRAALQNFVRDKVTGLDE